MKQILIKIHLYAKDPYGAKYLLLINKKESTGVKYLNVLKAFIEYANHMNNQEFGREKDENRADLCLCSIVFSFESSCL